MDLGAMGTGVIIIEPPPMAAASTSTVGPTSMINPSAMPVPTPAAAPSPAAAFNSPVAQTSAVNPTSPSAIAVAVALAEAQLPLNHSRFDLGTPAGAYNFLQAMLDDALLQFVGNQAAVDFWFGILVLVIIGTILRWSRVVTLRWRYKYSVNNKAAPSQPKSLWHKPMAYLTARGREAMYPQWMPVQRSQLLSVPPAGIIILVIVQFIYAIILEFSGIDSKVFGDQYYMALSVKAADLAIAQLPLLMLFAGKNSLATLLLGVSWERLNVLHRWTARLLLLLATIHLIAESLAWGQFGLTQLEWSTDYRPTTGLISFLLLLWLNLSSLAPIRHICYEFFVVQHVLSWIGFIVILIIHVPATAPLAHIWIQTALNMFIIDRLIRYGKMLYFNFRGSKARLEQLEGGVTRIRLTNPHMKKWYPGSFVLLSFPRLALGQSHPATIASTPSSHNGEAVFLLRNHTGFTGKLGRIASEDTAKQSDAERGRCGFIHTAYIDGPYGLHDDFAAFDSTVLIAGSTGVTFTLPILLDIAQRGNQYRLPLRRLAFIWHIKNRQSLQWIAAELLAAMPKLRSTGISAEFQIYLTGDDGVMSIQADQYSAHANATKGCTCDTKITPCTCAYGDGNAGRTPSTLSLGTVNSAAAEKIAAQPVEHLTTLQQLRLEGVNVTTGHCDILQLLSKYSERANGEMGVAVCGPQRLNVETRKRVTELSDKRGVHKRGRRAQGIHLHVEGFTF